MKKRGNLSLDDIRKLQSEKSSDILISILSILNEKIVPHISDIEANRKKALIELRHNLSDIIFLSKVLRDNSSLKMGRKFKNEIGKRIVDEEKKLAKSTGKLLLLSKQEIEDRMLQYAMNRKNVKIKEGEEKSSGLDKEVEDQL
jgi:hypothetical protein